MTSLLIPPSSVGPGVQPHSRAAHAARGPAQMPTPDDAAAAPALGLTAATALVVGSIIGTGIFTVPAALAGFGMVGVLAFVVVSIGAVALAIMYGSLARRLPAAGGPYAYARAAFGEFAGFTNAWSYWITSWAGNAAIVTGWVLYVVVFFEGAFGWHLSSVSWLLFFAMIGLWVPAMINLFGLREMGWFQVVTTVAKFLPLAFIATVGLFFIKADNFGPFNVSGTGWFSALSSAGVVVLFSFLGVEAASVAAGKVKDPTRNVPRATIIGTIASAVVYVLCTVAIFGVVGPAALQQSTAVGAPFVDTFAQIMGTTSYGWLVALVAVISGIGCLNGWTMICAEMPRAAAKDGLFPNAFTWLNRRGAPWFGIVIAAVLASIFTWISYQGAGGLNAFLTLVYLTGVTAAVPYFFSALAQVYWLFTDPVRVHPARLAIDAFVAVLAGLFSLWFVYGSGAAATYWAFLMILAGFAVYAVMRIVDVRRSPRAGVAA